MTVSGVFMYNKYYNCLHCNTS